MQITYAKLFTFINAANSYYAITGGKENKLTYALRKVIKINQSLVDEYNSESEDIKINFAAVDKNQTLIKTDGNYSYTKEGQKSLNEAVKNLNNKEVEVKAHIVKEDDIPADLIFSFREIFEGIVLPASAPEVE